MAVISDSAERATALDPTRSFCVSAPAGSGKTELLIQRYLALLARVERPEQILAITFTRKAAAEMRERVLLALEAAHSNAPVASEHEQVTRELAEAALQADAANTWQLLRDISRFNIKTIDSFCAGLTQQMPVLSQLGGQPGIEDDAQAYYEEAVVALFNEIDGSRAFTEDLAAIMLHFDNDWERLKELLVAMLARREQWLSYVGVHYEPDESERFLVNTVKKIVVEALEAVAKQLAPYETELLDLVQFAARNKGQPVPERFPDAVATNLDEWQPFLALLLIGTGTWRKKVDVRNGFPPEGDEAQRYKMLFKSLLEDLRQVPDLGQQLARVPGLPRISRGSESWQLVLHLSRLLPVLAAQLLLVFKKRQVADHAQIAQSALTALGDHDTPTDLALRLDYRIEHILVDEFQDTAVTQYELLDKLTRGWGEHNALAPQAPRTLFIVGDGMQSIYGFRGANVGLLLKAQEQGFNGVALTAIELTSNFRSQQGIVDWVNETFALAFPSHSNANLAQVRFSAATAVHPAAATPAVATRFFTGDHALAGEVEAVCEHVERLRAEAPGDSIAILGRSRAQLKPVLRRLRARGIEFYGQDLDSLASAPVIEDLMVLCRLLANTADRLSAMAALRAPWCGLTLADLLVLADYTEHARYQTLWHMLANEALIGMLSSDGQARMRAIAVPLQRARHKRDRLGLRVWVEQLWESLSGAAVVPQQLALEDVESFFALLEEADTLGIGLDIHWLERKLEKRFMAGGDVNCPLQILTLHKAKGLEFDHVIIPQTARSTQGDKRDILLWDEYSDASGNRGFLLAADDREKKAPTLYNFLSSRRKEKTRLESTRLFYVGATRAIKTLLITGCLSRAEKDGSVNAPAANSLLHAIWPAIESEVELLEPQATVQDVQDPDAPKLLRIASGAVPLIDAAHSGPGDPQNREQANHPARSVNSYDRIVGTVVHMAMEQLAQRASLPASVSSDDIARWRTALQYHGMSGDALEQAKAAVVESVQISLREGGKGRWVLSSAHVDARCEWPLTLVGEGGTLVDIVIDRTYVDAETDTRWVVDYKNSRPAAGQSLDEFLAGEAAQYRAQLCQYRDALRALDQRPVECALYFTALGELYVLPELALN